MIYSQRDNLGTGANLEFWTTDGNGNILPRMVVTDAGNVGINTLDTKGYQLAVNGQAIFTKAVVKLNANWPDYVFRKEYHLPSLDTVEKFILDHHHLSELPPADSVKKNGIDLESNQTLLLKKVEELTLYLIGQNKKLVAQEQELTILNQQLKEQARKIEELTARGH